MKVSKTKYDIELLSLEKEHKLKIVEMEYQLKIDQLKNTCNHKYDDGSSATRWCGMQHNGYEVCDICGKLI